MWLNYKFIVGTIEYEVKISYEYTIEINSYKYHGNVKIKIKQAIILFWH